MNQPLLDRRPRLALPFTVLTAPDRVRLVAGEDFRYTLSAPGIERWLPGLLDRLRGACTVSESLSVLEAGSRATALELILRLYGERVLVDGPAALAHVAGPYKIIPEGSGELFERLRLSAPAAAEGTALPVFCQDRLDYDAALRFQKRCRAERRPWLWATTGPMSRGYVGPLFLPHAGPCMGCLLGHFERLSPAPEIHRDLIEHARRGFPVEPVPFPPEGIAILEALIFWKASLADRPDPPPALFRLHALELGTMEVTGHRVFVDPDCPECAGGRA